MTLAYQPRGDDISRSISFVPLGVERKLASHKDHYREGWRDTDRFGLSVVMAYENTLCISWWGIRGIYHGRQYQDCCTGRNTGPSKLGE